MKRALSEQDMIDILEDIAANANNAAARIAAIKVLRAIDQEEQSVADGFQGLYDVANPGRLRSKAS